MLRTLLLASCVVATPALAYAQPSPPPELDLKTLIRELVRDDELIARVAKGSLDRGRRSFTLGPSVGLGYGLPIGEGEGDAALDIDLGIQLLSYDVPIFFSREELEEIVIGRLEAELTQRLARSLRGDARAPDRETASRIIREIIKETIESVAGKRRPKTFEAPDFDLRLQVANNSVNDVWILRVGGGIGISKVFASAYVGAQFGSELGGTLSLELSVPALISSGPLSPVVEPFARVDLVASGDELEAQDQLVLGARIALDVL